MAVPKDEELVATPYRHGSKEKAEKFFLDGMTEAMRRLAEQAHPAFPTTIYYAFKQSDTTDVGTGNTGWETFLEAVIRAGFGLSGTWPMRTELANRMIGSGTNALASSIILVCRKRAADAPTVSRRDFLLRSAYLAIGGPVLLSACSVVDRAPAPKLDAGARWVVLPFANTIIRNPDWRRKDRSGALRISPADAQALGVASGSRVRLSTRGGSVQVEVEVSDRMQPGVVYTTFHHVGTGANVITTDFSDWATNCPEYKVTAVEVRLSNHQSEWQREYALFRDAARRIASAAE